MAQIVSSPEAACETIHRYETFCGNLSPESCVRFRPGFDYWNNPEHHQAWNDYFNLCGQDNTRNSYECVGYLGIAAECSPNSEAPLEPVEAYNPPTEYQVANPVPVSVTYKPALEYQVCCQTTTEVATPSPVEGPSIELPSDRIPRLIDNPIAATPAPTTSPIAEPSIPDSPAGAVAEADTDEEAESVSGKVTNSAPGFFSMSGTGCSFQGQASRNFDSVEWLALIAALAILASRRATLRQ